MKTIAVQRDRSVLTSSGGSFRYFGMGFLWIVANITPFLLADDHAPFLDDHGHVAGWVKLDPKVGAGLQACNLGNWSGECGITPLIPNNSVGGVVFRKRGNPQNLVHPPWIELLLRVDDLHSGGVCRRPCLVGAFVHTWLLGHPFDSIDDRLDADDGE